MNQSVRKTVSCPSKYGPANANELHIQLLRALLNDAVRAEACAAAADAIFNINIGYDVAAMMVAIDPTSDHIKHNAIIETARMEIVKRLGNGCMYGIEGAGYVRKALRLQMQPAPTGKTAASSRKMNSNEDHSNLSSENLERIIHSIKNVNRRNELLEQLKQYIQLYGDAVSEEECYQASKVYDQIFLSLNEEFRVVDTSAVMSKTTEKKPKAKPRKKNIDLDWRTWFSLEIKNLGEKTKALADELRFSPNFASAKNLQDQLKLTDNDMEACIKELNNAAKENFLAAGELSEAYGHFRRLWEKTDGNPRHERVNSLYRDTPHKHDHRRLLNSVPKQTKKNSALDDKDFLQELDRLKGAEYIDGILLIRSHGNAMHWMHRIFPDLFEARHEPGMAHLEPAMSSQLFFKRMQNKNEPFAYLDQEFQMKEPTPRIIFGELLRIWDLYRDTILEGKKIREQYSALYNGFFGPNGTITKGDAR